MAQLEQIKGVVALSWKKDLIDVLSSFFDQQVQIAGHSAEFAADGQYVPELRSKDPKEVVIHKLEQARRFHQGISEVLTGEVHSESKSNLLGWVHKRITQALAAIDKKVYVQVEKLVADIFEHTLFYTADVVALLNGEQLERVYGNDKAWEFLNDEEKVAVTKRLKHLYGRKGYVSWQVSLGIYDPNAEDSDIKASLPLVFEADLVEPLYEYLIQNPEFIEPRANTMCMLVELLDHLSIPLFLTIGDSTRISVSHEVVYRLIVQKAPLSLEMLQALVEAEGSTVNLVPFVQAFL
ncbi:MAG TPA: hypothetical protein VF209_04325 [Patescibacteria group bacterium]